MSAFSVSVEDAKQEQVEPAPRRPVRA